MRKRIIDDDRRSGLPVAQRWLDLERIAEVEVTSEADAHPIEAALIPGEHAGWRAARAGPQVIRLRFDEPVPRLRHIHLLFEEQEQARTQEFVLRWSPDGKEPYREIVRQQYTFSPTGTTREEEDFAVELDGVTVLELRIVPDIGGGGARASLTQLRVA